MISSPGGMISRQGGMIRRFINLVLSNLIGQLQLVMVEINLYLYCMLLYSKALCVSGVFHSYCVPSF